MSTNRPSGVEEDRLDTSLSSRPSFAPRDTKHISIWCLALLVTVILFAYLLSSVYVPQPAPGQDQVAPGQNIGQ